MRTLILMCVALSLSTVAGLVAQSPAELSPTREYAKVSFPNPVRIGDNLLMGEYIIEHDADRMARGRPCTHIYSTKHPEHVVVKMYCTHLLRSKSRQATVTLRRDYNSLGHGYILTEFQYAGRREAHGVPGVRGVPLVR